MNARIYQTKYNTNLPPVDNIHATGKCPLFPYGKVLCDNKRQPVHDNNTTISGFIAIIFSNNSIDLEYSPLFR